MYDIARRTAVGAGVLLMPPVLVWATGWQWRPGTSGPWLRALFWMTETVTSPWGVLTSAILTGCFLWCLRFRLKPALGIVVIMVVTVLLGQGVKSLVKDRVQEPRPYVMWLEQQYQIDERYFYSLPRKARAELVKEQLKGQHQVPKWLRRHWQVETGFAFPSGHTMFAATWALLAVGVLWARRHYKTVVVLMAWAAAVMASRLALGMHWPQDLIAATLISWLLVVMACWLAQRWCGPLTLLPQETAPDAGNKNAS